MAGATSAWVHDSGPGATLYLRSLNQGPAQTFRLSRWLGSSPTSLLEPNQHEQLAR